ncbi:MAG: STAS domain-containing protein [Alphaproteobacteria bacterium]|nr:STAS domain-containing protein [Alphaproteobacteria bacterium]MBF0128977.1 STAS domain-containing protein [Alphaproteobacteria bacterium]
MTILAEEKQGVTIVSLSGEIDLQTSPEVRKSLLTHLEQGKDLIVDMHAVGYIDSSGVASLVEAYQTARQEGLRFSLAQVGQGAMRVLQLARLDRVFTIHATVDDGLESLKPAGG